MNTTRIIAFNTLVQLIGKAVTVATSIVIIAYLTRYLGVSGYGEYATVFAYLGIFSVFVDLGLFVITVRDISQKPETEKMILGNMLGLRISLGVLVFSLAALTAFILPYSTVVKTGILIGSASQFVFSLTQVPLSLFQARLVMYKATIADVVGRLLLLFIVWWLIRAQLGFLYIIAGVGTSNALVLLLGFWMSQTLVTIRPRFDFSVWRGMLISALPMGAVIILSTIYFRIDTVMLSVMKSSYDVGIYSAPYKILEVLLAVPSIFMSSVLPVMTRSFLSGTTAAQTIFRKAFNFLSMAALPLIFGTIAVATPLMVLLAGKDFSLSGPVLAILSLALGGSFLNAVMIYTIIAANEQKRLVLPYILATMFNILTNLLVIPRFSYFGAAITTVLTELLILIITYYIVRTKLKLFPLWSVFNRSLIASLMMAGILMALKLPVIWLVLIGASSYFLLLLLTRAITRADMAAIIPRVSRK